MIRIAARAALAALLLATTAARARAAEPPLTDEARVPLDANFSVAERVTIAGVGVAGIGALLIAPRVYQPSSRFGAGGVDRSISNALYPGNPNGDRFLGGVPDVAGLFVIPYLPVLAYGFETAWLERAGRPWRPGGDLNPDHRLWAYLEAIGFTALLTGVVKIAVGRDRPYIVLDHPELAAADREDRLSFYSSHAATSFCAASFVALDVSNRLVSGTLRDASPARRILLGRVLPYTLALGVASVVGVSRIIDQQHWASDVLVGALVGTAAAHVAYLVHFDTSGRPRRRHGGGQTTGGVGIMLAPMPSGVALVGFLP